MIVHVNLDDRLSILRTGDRFRIWNSLDDQRVCNVCERKFKGRQVEIRHEALVLSSIFWEPREDETNQNNV
jgi:hypothetical protein